MSTAAAKREQSFLQRHTALVVGVAVAMTVLVLILGALLYGVREQQLETLGRLDRPPVNGASPEAVGPQGRISNRSEQQINIILSETPHVVGAWVTKLQYQKTENPLIHVWTTEPVLKKFAEDYSARQLAGQGYSSEELNRDSAQSLRNSEEAKTGLIKCGPLESTNILKLSPGVAKIAKGVCRATLPPFDNNVNLGIVVVIDVEGDENGPDIQTIRRALLQLQIDIFNRDYQGRETWPRQTAPP